MQLTITALGYKLIAQAKTGGTKIKVSDFKLGTRNDYALLADFQWPKGQVVYSSRVTEAYVLSKDLMCFMCDVDYTEPEYRVGELALYVGTDLFAIGICDLVLTKPQGQALRFYAHVYAKDIEQACDLDYSADQALARVMTYNQVLPVDQQLQNSVTVLAGKRAASSETAPTMLVKSSAIDSQSKWLLVNGKLMFVSNALITSTSVFKLTGVTSAQPIGLDLAYAQIVEGPGAGQIRPVTYSSPNFTVSPAFTELTDDSVVEIWTSTGTVVPKCEPDIQLFDDPADDEQVLVDPDPLCGGHVQAVPVKPRKEPPFIINPLTPNPVVPPVYTVKPVQNYGIHFSGWPMVDVWSFNDSANELTREQGLRQRLLKASAAYGQQVFDQYFKFGESVNARNKYYYTVPFQDDSLNSINRKAQTQALPIQVLPNIKNSTISYWASDRLGYGDYQDFEQAVPKATLFGFHSILIPEGHRLMVFSGKNFTGRLVADLYGPLYIISRRLINHVVYSSEAHQPINYTYANAALAVAPPVELLDLTNPFTPQSQLVEPFPGPGIGSPTSFAWPFADELWVGETSNQIPKALRVIADEFMPSNPNAKNLQPTPYLLEPDIRKWVFGSCRVINLTRG